MDSVKSLGIELDVDGCEKLYDYGHSAYYFRPPRSSGHWNLTKLSGRHEEGQDKPIKGVGRMDRIIHRSGFTEKELKEHEKDPVVCPLWGGFVHGSQNHSLLQRTLPVLQAGDVVKGRVCLELTKSLQAENIRIILQGKAMTLIRIHTRDGHHDRKGEHIYTLQEKTFWQRSESEELKAGTHSFDFEFVLPIDCLGSTPDLLPSDREDYAYILYRLKAKIESGKIFTRDVVVYKGLWIDNSIDIASNIHDTSPVNMEFSRETGIACCKDMRIFCRAKLNRRAFVRGEEIPVTLEVENRTGRQINAVIAHAVLEVAYRSGTDRFAASRSRDVKGKSVVESGIPSNQFRVITISVPLDFSDALIDNNLIPTGTLKDCPIMNINYNLKITFKRPFWHRNIKILIPIKIGNIDCRGTMDY